MMAPEVASPAPTRRPVRIRGRRTWSTTSASPGGTGALPGDDRGEGVEDAARWDADGPDAEAGQGHREQQKRENDKDDRDGPRARDPSKGANGRGRHGFAAGRSACMRSCAASGVRGPNPRR